VARQVGTAPREVDRMRGGMAQVHARPGPLLTLASSSVVQSQLQLVRARRSCHPAVPAGTAVPAAIAAAGSSRTEPVRAGPVLRSIPAATEPGRIRLVSSGRPGRMSTGADGYGVQEATSSSREATTRTEEDTSSSNKTTTTRTSSSSTTPTLSRLSWSRRPPTSHRSPRPRSCPPFPTSDPKPTTLPPRRLALPPCRSRLEELPPLHQQSQQYLHPSRSRLEPPRPPRRPHRARILHQAAARSLPPPRPSLPRRHRGRRRPRRRLSEELPRETRRLLHRGRPRRRLSSPKSRVL
jgi:hypothetical protein